MKGIHFTVFFLCTMLLAGCGSVAEEMRGTLDAPLPTRSQYLATLHTQFEFELRAGKTESYYLITVEATKDLIKERSGQAYLTIEYENPENKNEPYIVYTQMPRNENKLRLKSPPVHGRTSYKNYEIVIYLYKDEARSQLLGEHRQLVRSYMDEIE